MTKTPHWQVNMVVGVSLAIMASVVAFWGIWWWKQHVPAADWLEIRALTIRNAIEGNDPTIIYDRVIKQDVAGTFVVSVYRFQEPADRKDFWGAPNVIQRIILGCDENLKQKILASGHWTGTPADLEQLIADQVLAHPPVIPIRDAIDFVYSSIASTIKGLKFSSLSQTCGGPIEIAVITTDRKFRWVRHKQWDAAINEGDP